MSKQPYTIYLWYLWLLYLYRKRFQERSAVVGSSSRSPYKIFSNSNKLEIYLQKNKDKICENMEPVFVSEKYREFKNTQVRKLTQNEIEKYIDEK